LLQGNDMLTLAERNVLPHVLWQELKGLAGEAPKFPNGPPLQKMLSPEMAADIAGLAALAGAEL
ncbi:unnamed protein product, partial [Effrenium voratum]